MYELSVCADLSMISNNNNRQVNNNTNVFFFHRQIRWSYFSRYIISKFAQQEKKIKLGMEKIKMALITCCIARRI